MKKNNLVVQNVLQKLKKQYPKLYAQMHLALSIFDGKKLDGVFTEYEQNVGNKIYHSAQLTGNKKSKAATLDIIGSTLKIAECAENGYCRSYHINLDGNSQDENGKTLLCKVEDGYFSESCYNIISTKDLYDETVSARQPM